MRHRRKGRKLGRNPKHQRALLRSLASALILTLREYDEEDIRLAGPTFKPPKVQGRIVTTLQKAKEVRPFLEKCITLARKAQPHLDAAAKLRPDAERYSDEWTKWRKSDQWQEWNKTIAPAVALRRRAYQLLHDEEAVAILFNELGPRFEDRDGGYTRIIKIAQRRLGDAGVQAILEFVGERDRVKAAAVRPAFDDEMEEADSDAPEEEAVEEETVDEGGVEEAEAVEDEEGSEEKE